MKIKVVKKRKSRLKNQNDSQLELTFVESSKRKNKDISPTQTINSISRIFLSSFVLVSFFYIAPILINFADKNFNTKEYTNNSKKILIFKNTTKKVRERKIHKNTLSEFENLEGYFYLFKIIL